MNPVVLQNPFVTTALPIMFTVLTASWMNSKGFDGVHKRLDDISRRLEHMEIKLDDHAGRIVRLEAGTSPLKR